MTPKKNKSKNKKKSKSSKHKGLKPNQSSVLLKTLKSFWLWIAIFFALLGYYVVFDYFSPRLSIYPNVYLNPSQPFSTTFLINNAGNLPIKDFHYLLLVKRMETMDGVTIINTQHDYLDTIHTIKPSRKSTIDISKYITISPYSVKSADIFIKYTFKPYYFYFTKTDSHNFKLKKHHNGKYHWSEY